MAVTPKSGPQQPPLMVIQDEPEHTGEVPLVLIHDGGGTVVSYHSLKSLGRPVYAIPDVTLGTDQSWESIAQMAETYSQVVQQKFIAGPVLLGGWSLGGFVSLHMSRILERSQGIDVVGLVLIDASYLKAGGDLTKFTADGVESLLLADPAGTGPSIEGLIQTTRTLVTGWEPPVWDAEALGTMPPPTALLCARERVQPARGSAGAAALVDACRDEPMLGWTKYDPDLIRIKSVINGHHFAIFDKQHIGRLSQQLADVCQALSNGDY